MGMPTTHSDLPNIVKKGLRTVFFKALDGFMKVKTPQWKKIATKVPSTHKSEDYGWLGQAPSMREWVDERAPRTLKDSGFSISNLHYEASISVDRDALADDNYGSYKVRTQDMAWKALLHPNKLLATLLEGNGLCYDGQNYIDTEHLERDSGTQSNKGTTALAEAAIEAGIIAMGGFKDDTGEIMGIRPNILMVPRQLEFDARRFVKSMTLTTQANPEVINTLYNLLEVVMNPWLTDANNWYLFHTESPVKPFIFQDRQPLQFDAVEEGTEAFRRRFWEYGVDARYNVGFGMWQFCYGAIVA